MLNDAELNQLVTAVVAKLREGATSQSISQLTALTDLANGDLFITVDVSDPTMAPAGTDKKITAQNLRSFTSEGLAPLLSPPFTGTPTAPTPTVGDNTTKIATTAFVATAISAIPAPAVASVFGRTGTVVATTGDYTVDKITGAAPLNAPSFTGGLTVASGGCSIAGNTDIFGSISLTADGDKVNIATGVNGTVGELTLTGATLVSVGCTVVTEDSLIVLSKKTNGGVPGIAPTYTLQPGTGFEVTGSTGDTSVYMFWVIN